jgi:PqqD family protein of HPr-rel-A system
MTRAMEAAQASAAVPRRRQDLVVHELDGEALVYDPTTSDTHRLNETAYFVWLACDGTRDATDIAHLVTDRYAVSLESALEHIEQVLAAFQARRLIVESERESDHGRPTNG